MSRLLKSCIANQLNFFSKPQTWKKKQNFFFVSPGACCLASETNGAGNSSSVAFFLSSTTHEIERKSCSPSRRQKIVGGKT